MTRRKRTPRRLTFTARTPNTLAPEAHGVDWFDDSTPGLALHVSPGGARSWYLFYQKGRTTRRVKLGTWPALELARARKLARSERVRVETTGADPAFERQENRAAFTVGDMAKVYIEQHARPLKKTWKDDQWRLNRYILPAWKSRPVADITRGDVHAILDKIAGDGKGTQANRVQALISKVWNLAIDRGHATANPCHRMAKRAPEQRRATVLDDDALRALWAALDANPGEASDAVRLRLLTGQRGGEVHAMTWGDVDLKAGVWTIPASAAKNGRAHRVPLAADALAVIEARQPEKAKTAEPVFGNLYHQRKDLRALGTVHDGAYRWHDLRRVVATRLAALGHHEDTIGRVLNHAKRGITATVYNQHDYDREKRAALDAWALDLARIVAGKPKPKVLAHQPRGRRVKKESPF